VDSRRPSFHTTTVWLPGRRMRANSVRTRAGSNQCRACAAVTVSTLAVASRVASAVTLTKRGLPPRLASAACPISRWGSIANAWCPAIGQHAGTGARVCDDTGRHETAAFRDQIVQDGRISRPRVHVVGYMISEAVGRQGMLHSGGNSR